MREILKQNNAFLLGELARLEQILQASICSAPGELRPFADWVGEFCDACRKTAVTNLQDLNLGQDIILSDILSNTQVLTRSIYLLNRRLVSPILRARASDRLCLKLLQWLHLSHPRTRHLPMAMSDGDFASWPILDWPTIYFMPPSSQHSLLCLPLFCHEFGHLLYVCHKPEMDDLVKDLQHVIGELLKPNVQRDDRYARRDEGRRSAIVETWYEWTHELFCDAVGITLGGPAFLHAFSMYCRMLGRDEFQLRFEELRLREHPVTWLRVRLLADRARRTGYRDHAAGLEKTWSEIAETMGVVEDYYGFYAIEFLSTVQKTIDDMLGEAEPLSFQQTATSQLETPSPVHLLNKAWEVLLEDSYGYDAWERKAIEAFLDTDNPP